MKIKQIMAAGIFSLLSFLVSAQDKPEKPAWVSDNGYWVVETNINSPLQHTVRFYTNDHIQIGRQELTGVKLDTRKRKVKMRLKESLEASLIAWKKNTPADQAPAIASGR